MNLHQIGGETTSATEQTLIYYGYCGSGQRNNRDLCEINSELLLVFELFGCWFLARSGSTFFLCLMKCFVIVFPEIRLRFHKLYKGSAFVATFTDTCVLILTKTVTRHIVDCGHIVLATFQMNGKLLLSLVLFTCFKFSKPHSECFRRQHKKTTVARRNNRRPFCYGVTRASVERRSSRPHGSVGRSVSLPRFAHLPWRPRLPQHHENPLCSLQVLPWRCVSGLQLYETYTTSAAWALLLVVPAAVSSVRQWRFTNVCLSSSQSPPTFK